MLKKVSLSLWTCLNVENRLPYFVSNRFYYYGKHGPKGEYAKVDEHVSSMPRTEVIRLGLSILKEELKVWTNEIKEKLEADPILVHRPGEIEICFRFDKGECEQKWIASCDQDHKEGFSSCTFTQTPYGTGLFHGNLSTRVPKDGRTKKAGYCNITSIRKQRSFKRNATYDWQPFSHLVFKVRGDGRPYMLNLLCPGDYDILWNDIYHYVLYTRGGPYWQLTKIPFSKFFLGAKGRVQDLQCALPLNRVSSLGITAADGNDGPFSLEIDYIGVEYDPDHKEEFAYEMYQHERFIVKS